MRIAYETIVCECCALWIANRDDSGCRDYWGHDHRECDLGLEPGEHAVVGEYDSLGAYRCAGCGDDHVGGSFAVVILAP